VKLDFGCIWQEEGHFGYGEEARDFDGSGRTTPEWRGGRRKKKGGEDIQTKERKKKETGRKKKETARKKKRQ
jgi:hypothetical protein